MEYEAGHMATVVDYETDVGGVDSAVAPVEDSNLCSVDDAYVAAALGDHHSLLAHPKAVEMGERERIPDLGENVLAFAQKVAEPEGQQTVSPADAMTALQRVTVCSCMATAEETDCQSAAQRQELYR